jgi:hypothetical protein
MNHTNNRGIAKNIPNIEIKQRSQIILMINQIRATVFFDCGSLKVGVKFSSVMIINKNKTKRI